MGLGVHLSQEFGRFRPTLESGLLENRWHVGVRQQLSVALLVPVEHGPDAGVVIGVAVDARAPASVLLALLSALGGEDVEKPLDILDLHGGNNQRWAPFGDARPNRDLTPAAGWMQ